jgi:hypothetical protein
LPVLRPWRRRSPANPFQTRAGSIRR